MSTAVAHPHFAAIDAALAKGAWWRQLFRELSRAAMARVGALDLKSDAGLWRVAQDFERFARAARLCVVAGMRLAGFLSGLADLRKLSPADFAAARARATAKAVARAAARARARERAKARRAARAAEIRETVIKIIEREKPEPCDRDPLVAALDRRLSVDPALVGLDDLPLHEAVIRICKDLGVTPDWRRWETGDWRTIDPQAGEALIHAILAPRPKQRHALAEPEPPTKVLPSEILEDVSRRLARRTDTAISIVLQAGPFTPPWLPPRPG